MQPKTTPESGPETAALATMEEVLDLAPLNIIRTENVLSRFPVHNLSKKGKIDVQILRRNPQGEVEIRWEVAYSEKHGQARQVAYKLDTIVINRRIAEENKPLPKIIRLGSLRDIAEQLSMGGNTNVIKRALRQNASAFITVKISYTTVDGHERTLEADFTRYSVIFAGEKLPDNRKADAVYIGLNDVYWNLLNEAPQRPQDYDYLKALAPAAQRFYEIIAPRFYSVFRYANPNASKIAYSEYCEYSAQQRYFDYEHFKKQMYKVHQPHKQSGYLAAVSYKPAEDEQGRPDWLMCYEPGPKARNEHDFFTGKARVLETKLEPHRNKRVDSQLVAELVKRGIDEKIARQLLQSVADGQDVMEQLEYADYRIASAAPGTFRNPPGFYISVIRENAPAPENFESSRKRREREDTENQREQQRLKRVELEEAYAEYKRGEVDTYIQQHLPVSEHEAMIEEIKRNYVAQFRNAAHWPAETLHMMAVNAASVEISKRLTFLLFDEFCKRHSDL
jgi:hypothetical protein